jgi:hypothetical protein
MVVDAKNTLEIGQGFDLVEGDFRLVEEIEDMSEREPGAGSVRSYRGLSVR